MSGESFATRILTEQLTCFIDGQLQNGQGNSFESYNPSTGQLLGTVSCASTEQVDLAVSSAHRAFTTHEWSTDRYLRARVLHKLAGLVEQHTDAIAYLDALEAGKPIQESRSEDIPDVVANLRYYADLISNQEGRFIDDPSAGWGWIKQIPVGVVAAVLPWNYPIAMLGWKTAPALAAGNSLILKPSEESFLSALYLAELAAESGVPEGVLTVLAGTGKETGSALGRHPAVDMVSFTGSGEVGREFLKYSAESNLKKIALELGGRAAYVIDYEHVSDLSAVCRDALAAAFGTSGQNCTAPARVVVVGTEEAKAHVDSELCREAKPWMSADPLTSSPGIGPIISQEAQTRLQNWISEAVESGAEILYQGSTPEGDGYWIPPTVLTAVSDETHLGRYEVFGPIARTINVTSREEAVSLINDDRSGLASTVWCENLATAKWWSDKIRVGTLAVNGYSEGTVATPFGGLRESGFWGRDNGREALAGYQEPMVVWIGQTDTL